MIPKWAYLNKNSNGKVFYSAPYIDEKDTEAMVDALVNGKWSSSGEKVVEFEKAFSKKFNVNHSVMVNSGSSANFVMIAALKKYFGWKDGDEVITSVVGFPTTISAITLNNLNPVFIDIEMETLNMDVESKLYSKITDKTKAIFIAPAFGNPPDLIKVLSYNKNVKLILDCCDSLGTTIADKYIGKYAVASSCSMYATHIISTIEGGMVSSDCKEIIDIARSISWWGRDCKCSGSNNMLPNGQCNNRFSDWLDLGYNVDHRYVFSNIGMNLKPLDFQGALGLSQLAKFDEMKSKRKENFEKVSELFKKYIKSIKIPMEQRHYDVCWFAVPIICKTSSIKEKLVPFLEANGIQTRNFFAGNILTQPAYKHLGNHKDYLNADQVLKRIFFVGCAPHYDADTLSYIEEVLKKYEN